MARKRKKARKKPRRSKSGGGKPDKTNGFDFGCLPHAMAVGLYDFPRDLHDASIDGVAYGEAWSEEVAQVVPVISLIAKNDGPLGKAFAAFNEWADVTDPDSLELTFVFRPNGGYVLALSPEPSRLLRRCLGFDRTFRPIMTMETWCKQIDSTHQSLHKIREYSREPIAPFLFDGATYSGPISAAAASSAPPVRKVPGLEALLKFEATFVDEKDVERHTVPWLALEMAAPNSSNGPPKKDRPISLPEITGERVKTLRAHFPVTLERLRRSSGFSKLESELSVDRVARWQIEQAFCNLTLSQELGCGAHYKSLSAIKAEKAILEALQGRYEVADGATASCFSADLVRTQILADANVLLRKIGKRPARDLLGAQSALRSASALEVTTAVSDLLTT